jgi:hypothetical protein
LIVERQPVVQSLPRIFRKIGESYSGAAQRIGPRNVAGCLEVSVGIRQIETEMKPAVGLIFRFKRDHGLHRQTLLTEVENHAAGYAVEAGEDRAVDFMSDATATLRKHLQP